MGFNDKQNNADGRDPDFGAIFMSNTGTKRECFKRRLFGLPSSEIQFVEQVKAGMILFLFEYVKRQLHGVFKASCDGAMNIVPNAFSSSGKQFSAQVKFIPIWYCKPLPESLFHDAIRENYFSANKFNFGLSEKQVYKLLYLFSMRKLELEVPRRQLTTMKDLKSEWYPVGKVGKSVDHGVHVESVQNEQGVGANNSPIIMHKYQGDSLHYNGEVENIGFNASDIVVNKQGRAAELAVDTTSGYASDYLSLKDECGFTEHQREHYMDMHLRPTISGGHFKSPFDKIRVHGDGRLSVSNRLMSEDLRKTGQRMVFAGDNAGLHHSSVNPSVFYNEPILERNSLVQNQIRPTSTMIHPIQAQILNNSCATQGEASSKSPLLYDPDAPGLNFSQSSSVRINNGSRSILESASPSNNCRWNSLSNQPCLMHTELKDMNRCHHVGYGFLNPGPYGSNRDCMPFNAARNSDQLAAESVAYDAGNSIPSLKSSSARVPPPDIGNSDRVHEPFSSLFHNYKSCVGNDAHPIALRENLGHEMTLQKNNDAFTPIVPWANEGHSLVQYGDPLIHEYDIGCYGNPKNNNSGYPKKKGSVFSRLSFLQDVSKQENGNNARNEEYDFNTSVDEVMEMVRQSHGQWLTKRMPKPLVKYNNAESLRDKSKIISSRMKSDCFENTVKNVSMDLTTSSEGNTNETAEEICFVDFKRRSKVRKLNDEIEIRSSNESEKSENLVLVPQKRRKLNRPNFSKSTNDKGINLGAFQILEVPLLHESCNLKDVSESCCSLVQTEDNIKTDVEVQNFISQTHSEDKSSSHASGYVCSDGGGKARDGALTAFNDGSECLEIVNNENAVLSASCKDKSSHIKDMESLHSICEEHYVDNVICAGRCVNTEERMSKDGGSSFTIEVEDGSDCLQNSGNEKAPIGTYCHIKEGLGVDSIKSVSTDTESLHSICQEHQVGKIICAGRGINTEKEMSEDSGFSFTAEVKDGSDCLRNSGSENAPIATSCRIEEGLCMTDSIKSESPETESLCSLCHEHHVDKVICAGRDINTEAVLKDGSSTFTAEVKDGSDCLQNSGNDNAPMATSCE